MKRFAPLSFGAATLLLAACADEPTRPSPRLGEASSTSGVEPAGFRVTVTDLGTLPGGTSSVAEEINDRGQVVGWSEVATPQGLKTHAFLWTAADGMRDLGTLPGGRSFSRAFGINDRGQVVGQSGVLLPPPKGFEFHAFLWTAAGGMRDLGTWPGGDGGGIEDFQSRADGINNRGQVVGVSSPVLDHAVLWTAPEVVRDLGTLPGGTFSHALAINAQGQVVGFSEVGPDGITHAFLWTEAGGMRDLGTLPGAFVSGASGINDRGQVVGGSDGQAFLWTEAGGMRALGTLPGGSGSGASGINNLGQVVGSSEVATPRGLETHAFLWTEAGGMRDLGTLPGGSQSGASGINDRGQAVGVSDGTGFAQHATLWTIRSRGGGERHPAITNALRALWLARGNLRHASSDFGGHRTAAIREINRAIAELRAALRLDDTPPPQESEAAASRPALERALDALQKARGGLRHARSDFGGHRTAAIEHINAAIAEVNQARRFGR